MREDPFCDRDDLAGSILATFSHREMGDWGLCGIVPSSCVDGFVDVPAGARPVEFPSFDVGGDDGGGRGGAVGGVEHGVGSVGVIADGA